MERVLRGGSSPLGRIERGPLSGPLSDRLLGETTTEVVTDRVIEAILNDRPEVIESGAPIRPLLALGQLSPRLVERLAPRLGLTEYSHRVAVSRGRST